MNREEFLTEEARQFAANLASHFATVLEHVCRESPHRAHLIPWLVLDNRNAKAAFNFFRSELLRFLNSQPGYAKTAWITAADAAQLTRGALTESGFKRMATKAGLKTRQLAAEKVARYRRGEVIDLLARKCFVRTDAGNEITKRLAKALLADAAK